MPPVASEELESINRKLAVILKHCQASSNVSPETLGADFQILRESLMQAGKFLRAAQIGPALDGELLLYGKHLEALRQWLPSIQLKLEIEKGRIGKTLDHLQIASAWAVASQKSFR
jgi:hypothetical protein